MVPDFAPAKYGFDFGFLDTKGTLLGKHFLKSVIYFPADSVGKPHQITRAVMVNR